MCVYMRARVCVCVREREREKSEENVCVCVCVLVCLYVCEREWRCASAGCSVLCVWPTQVLVLANFHPLMAQFHHEIPQHPQERWEH